MMADLIDRAALIHRLCAERDEVQIEHACDVGYHNGLNMAVSMTINAPAVDAVVLPCKVGDTVYAVGEGQYKKCDIDEACINCRGEVIFDAYFACDNDCEGCPFNSWHQEYSGGYSCDGEWGQAIIKADDFGKTVFLSREEAEVALNGEGREDNG